jgi:hypothetical protein
VDSLIFASLAACANANEVDGATLVARFTIGGAGMAVEVDRLIPDMLVGWSKRARTVSVSSYLTAPSGRGCARCARPRGT